jgi:hypothetical protein
VKYHWLKTDTALGLILGTAFALLGWFTGFTPLYFCAGYLFYVGTVDACQRIIRRFWPAKHKGNLWQYANDVFSGKIDPESDL